MKKTPRKHLSVRVGMLSLLLIVGLAFLLRSNLYLRGDFFYLLDQARDLILVKDIVTTHKGPLIGARSGLGGIFHGPLWLIIITPFFLITGGNPFWTLIPLFLLVSLGIVVGGFFIFKRLYDIQTGLIVSFLLAVNPALMAANLITTNAQVMPLIVLLFLWGVIEYLRGKKKYIMLLLLAVGLAFQFESAFAIFLLPLILLAVLFTKKLPPIKYTIIGIVLFILSVSNFLLFEVRHSFLMTHAAVKLFTNKVEPLRGYEKYADIGYRIGNRLHLLGDYYLSSLLIRGNIEIILVILVQLFAFSLVLRSYIKEKRLSQLQREYVFLLLIPILFYGLYIFYPMPLWSHYLLSIHFIAAIFVAISVKMIFTERYGKMLGGLFILALSFSALMWLHSAYLAAPYKPTEDGSYLNQLNVANAVFSDAGKRPFGYFEYNNGILTYQMDYLMWWLNTTHHVQVSNKKADITYLIMYPPPGGDNNAHNYWKKNVLKTNGRVLSRKTFPGGITLEKLSILAGEPEVDPNYYQGLLFR